MPHREEEKQFIQDPNRWPQWPVLPVKNPQRAGGGINNTGYLYGDPVPPIKVYIGNIFTMSKDDPFEEYSTVDALQDAGWVVD